MSFIDDVSVLGRRRWRDEDESKIYGVVVGRVVDLLDPMLLGRVRVEIPSIDALDESPWARVATPAASMASGLYWIPNVGDEVLVAFEHGDLDAPYIIGCLWSAIMPPALPSPLPQIRLIRTPLGNQIMFTEEPPSIMISTATQTQRILMDPTGVTIMAGANIIRMSADGITITGTPTIKLIASQSISLAAPTVSIVGANTASLASPGTCRITSPQVKINSP